jgi:3-hydroxyisobutyrate dehydrogenase
LAKNVGLSLPVAQATFGQYRRLIELGKGNLDKSAVAESAFKDRLGSQ